MNEIKQYVLDTNVLIHDPESIFAFEEHVVIVPIHCIEEIDSFKHEQTERGRSARHVSRYLDSLREEGNLLEGVPLEGGGLVKISVARTGLGGNFLKPDNDTDSKILVCAIQAKLDLPKRETILVTLDVNLRIRASAYGVETETYEHASVQIDALPKGFIEVDVSKNIVDQFYASGRISIEDISIKHNEYVVLQAGNQRVLCKKKDSDLVPITKPKDGIWGLRPRNMEQQFAVDMLLNDEIKLCTLVGGAGTGKTIMAIASALSKVEDGVYNKLVVTRPIVPIGKDIGALPGEFDEKMHPWMYPIWDNVETLMNIGNKQAKKQGRSPKELVELGLMEVVAITHMRGRSMPNQFILIDEAQNLTKHEILTIVTRAGEGTKIVLVGDTKQIDSPYLNEENNGLTHVVTAFTDQKIAGHITLSKGERSELAEIASKVL